VFDEAFSARLQSVKVPDELFSRIIAAAQPAAAQPGRTKRRGVLLQWIHPAAFAAAAAIILLLALSFTFWNRPGAAARHAAGDHLTAHAGGGVPERLLLVAHKLYAETRPSFRSSDSNRLIQHLSNRGGVVPASMPDRFSWDKAMACDVIEYDGLRVSMLCFKADDQSGMLHLFTFRRSDFPDAALPVSPQIATLDGTCCATWADADQIHVLYSEKGEEKLRQWLDI
jgi:hypothetical protein